MPFAVAQNTTSSGPIRTIFVAPLECQNQGACNLLQAKLIASLSKLSGIAVVEDEKDADAILTGAGLFEAVNTGYGHTVYRIQFGMRLISRAKGIVLWADDVASSRFARSASSSFSDNCAKSVEDYLRSRPTK